MKKLIFLTVLALAGIALSCEKDSVWGVENEALELRNPGDAFIPSQKVLPFKAYYTMNKVAIDKGAIERRPGPDPLPVHYMLEGDASYLGKLLSSKSYEEHFPLKFSAGSKRLFHANVRGALVSTKGNGAIYYEGTCAYWPKGEMHGKYRFYSGTGNYKGVSGYMDIDGIVYKNGWVVSVHANGEIAFPRHGWIMEKELMEDVME